ncbi:DNA replication and repair protein RecF [Methylohalomonas lacus]|uniref:DNA replication and repair protein RecF n=1 Tax=Methylohalomonas lacus TaxID=398773 RepID=A0AAE3HMS1_9GAMM|nr:DNA replication/repair protein RecF [Methylohalomonas lacus]MCS3903328.1 DNA replication and repair protein RecF [Methylohalomonas lacus]
MQLSDLRISHLRNLDGVSLEPGAGLNIISGANASGKTALLESIYLLARGRSFRTHRIRELISHHQQQLRVTARALRAGQRPLMLGIERDGRQTRLRCDGENVRNLSAHARRVPLILITPDSHGLISGRPGQRRRWLDWALFHVEPDYLGCWQDCFHALRQRNALLKHGAGRATIVSWEESLADCVNRLEAYREGLVQQLSGHFSAVMSQLLPGTVQIEYLPGRPREQDYRTLLAEQRDLEQQRGFTRYGPHRSDLDFRHQDGEVRATLSRGQTKLYIAGLMIAYVRVLADYGLQPLILVDDLPAELDAGARARFMAHLAETGCQTFVTAIEPETLPLAGWPEHQVFHVEHGQLTEVI